MKVLVTGGGGFLGRVVCAQLVAAGHQVRAFNRNHYPALGELGVEQRLGDLRRAEQTAAAIDGCQAVLHCAAKAGAWGPEAEFRAVNVRGTGNVLAGCRRHGVDRLVYTSSPSVVHGGGDLRGVDESAPYPDHYLAPYPRTKAAAERMVLAANSPHLATVSLRPHLIWGPGDPHFLPRIVGRARAGRLRLIGAADKLVDTIYVDNAAEAHLLALDKLVPGSPIAGKAYFLSQGEPHTTAETLNALLRAAGLPPETRRVPVPLARLAGAVLEAGYRLARVRAEPPLTRFLVEHLTTAHWFDISAARRDLGYQPRVGSVEGLHRLAEHLAAHPEQLRTGEGAA